MFWNKCKFYDYSIVLVKTNYDTIVGGYSTRKWEHFGDGPYDGSFGLKNSFLFTWFQNNFKEF